MSTKTRISQISEAKALIAGVAAAPSATDRRASLKLLLPPNTPGMLQHFLQLESEMRSQIQEPESLPIADRVALLRQEMAKQKLDGFVVPHADEHQCEFTPRKAERLAWLSGFDGSNGECVVLLNKAFVSSDFKYKLSLPRQTDKEVFQVKITNDETAPAKWVAKNLKKGGVLGYDPWLMTPAQLEPYQLAVQKRGGQLRSCPKNLIDLVWQRQPAAPISPIVAHPIQFAGVVWQEKVAELSKKLIEAKVGALVLTNAASIAWLLNIRGADVEGTPLPLCFAIVFPDGSGLTGCPNAAIQVFCDQRKLSRQLEAHLDQSVKFRPLEEFSQALSTLGMLKLSVQVDPATAACAIFNQLKEAGAEIVEGGDPCTLPKACKNAIEIEGSRQAHLRDGAALCRFFAWLEKESPKGQLTEMTVAQRLNAERGKDAWYRSVSFPTTVAADEHGADIHFHITAHANRRIVPGTKVLIDSGGQFLDGTTDVTRMTVVGEPTAAFRKHSTLVLKGMIAVARQRFPVGTSGQLLDSFARSHLWQAGLDYDHGTGHGVGSYGACHEGPQRISWRLSATHELLPGMILSDEPGYYREGEYGIRWENLMVVSKATKIRGGDRKMMSFETLTMVPIDLKLIDPKLMSADEIDWLNDYHAKVRQALTPLLEGETLVWLGQATRPLQWARSFLGLR